MTKKSESNNYRCGASVASEQQHNQALKGIYKREYEFSNSSLFTRMHCATKQHKDVIPDVMPSFCWIPERNFALIYL